MTIFPKRWAPSHPDRLQLYSLATPNGQKIAIALEELGVPYEAHTINILNGDQFDPDYVAINPNGKIPTLIDPEGPNGEPIAIMESGAILWHLARKFGRLLPDDDSGRLEVLEWLFFQVGHVGPMFGQFGHFYKYAKGKTDTYGERRYGAEVGRLLGVLDRRLDGRAHLVGDELTIADIAHVPWINALDYYGGKEFVGYGAYRHVHAWVERFMARPAVQRGIKVTGFP